MLEVSVSSVAEDCVDSLEALDCRLFFALDPFWEAAPLKAKNGQSGDRL